MALNNMDAETEALLSEGTDPVSGNDVPLGATPEEVRDDIDARVSENEYVIPAYAVRYFGPRFFDELLASAQQGWERIKAGEEEMPQTQMPEAQPTDMNFAEGGPVPKPVGGGYGGYGGTGVGFGGFESKTFVNDSTGQQIIIYYYNGKPMSRIPEGFREKGATPVEEQAVQQQQAETDDNDSVDPFKDSIYSKPVSEWSTSDFDSYTNSLLNRKNPGKLNFIEKGILGFVGSMIGGPLGGLAITQLAERGNAKQAESVSKRAAEIISSGIDPSTGEALSGSAIKSLNDARIVGNFVQQNLDSNPFYESSVDEETIIDQQQAAIKAARKDVETKMKKGMSFEDAARGSIYDTGGAAASAPGGFYGGSAAAEADFIFNSTLSDDAFFNEFKLGTPSGAGNIFTGSASKASDLGSMITTSGAASTGAASSRAPVVDEQRDTAPPRPPARPESITRPSDTSPASYQSPGFTNPPTYSSNDESDDNDDGGWDDFSYDPNAYSGISAEEQLWNKGGLVQRPNKK